ncbi:MAG: LemA family protein, partial [Actinomycetes bacterium]
RVYNTKVESVPTNLIANTFKFEKATYFEVNDPSVRQTPNVSFGEIAYRGDPQSPQSPAPGQLPGSVPPQQYGQPNALPDPQSYDPSGHPAPQVSPPPGSGSGPQGWPPQPLGGPADPSGPR